MSDLISRQTVTDMVKGWNLNQHIMNEEDAIDDVNAIPSAQPELIEKAAYIRGFEQGRTQGIIDSQGRKKGEWINKAFYGIGEGSAECSICHKRSSGYQEDDGWSVHCLFYDFCPNCGARMKG